MENPTRICARFAPAIYAFADLKPGETLEDAKRKLKPHVDKGRKCCAIYRKYAIYFEPDGTETVGPLPQGGLRLPLKPLAG